MRHPISPVITLARLTVWFGALLLPSALQASGPSPQAAAGQVQGLLRSCRAGQAPRTPLAPLLVRSTQDPPRTQWVPSGQRYTSLNEIAGGVFPERDHYVSIHGGVRSPDEISIAFAPVFSASGKTSWTSWDQLFVPEGAGFDGEGNVYITPTNFGAPDTAVIYAIDRNRGTPLWTVGKAQTGQGGVPMALGPAGREIIYGGGYESIYAVRRDGSVLWNTATGLSFDADDPNVQTTTHLYGVSYHQATDSILAEYGSGEILAFDRATCRLKAQYKIDGDPAVPSTASLPQSIKDAADAEFRATFNFDNPAASPMDLLLNVALGNGLIIANYFSSDPNSNRIWVAATLPDGHEGDTHPGDGYSEDGALYGIDLTETGFRQKCVVPFKGGTASTPTLRADGKRIYTADAVGRALAYDTSDCALIWSVDLRPFRLPTDQYPSQIDGSLSLSSVGGEIYASTGDTLFKIVETGDTANVAWRADIASIFRGDELVAAAKPLVDALKAQFNDAPPISYAFVNFNLAATAENGVMIQAAAGPLVRLKSGDSDFPILFPLAMSMTLLDRQTGKPINSTAAVEETFAAITSGPQGATAIGNSPFRRLLARAAIDVALESFNAGPGTELRCIADWLVPPLTGGVTKYGISGRSDLLARDAACGGSTRLANTIANVSDPDGVAGDVHDTGRLIRQATAAVNAAPPSEIPPPRAAQVRQRLVAAAAALEREDLQGARGQLTQACGLLDEKNGPTAQQRR
jgi:hypothetical protein